MDDPGEASGSERDNERGGYANDRVDAAAGHGPVDDRLERPGAGEGAGAVGNAEQVEVVDGQHRGDAPGHPEDGRGELADDVVVVHHVRVEGPGPLGEGATGSGVPHVEHPAQAPVRHLAGEQLDPVSRRLESSQEAVQVHLDAGAWPGRKVVHEQHPQRAARYVGRLSPTVLHYLQRWLPLSAGFVHAHVRHSRYAGLVVAREPLEHESSFPHRPVVSLAPLLRLAPAWAGRRPLTAGLVTAALVHRARLVHVHFGYPVGDVLGAARRLRLPIVVSLHGDDALGLPRRSPQHYREVTDVVAAVVVPSSFLAAAAAEIGFDPARTHVVPAGVDTRFFTPGPLPEGPPQVLFVGRLVEKKGLDILVAAWPAVRRRVPGATLRIIGEGPLAPLLSGRGADVVHERPDPGRRATQVRDAIRASALVVQPSRTAKDGDAESLLLVNLEAQASGRPVVSTRHGGIPEFVDHGSTGLLVPEADVGALAAAMTELLLDVTAASRMGAAGARLAARFDVRTCSARLDALYDELLARG